MSVHIHCQHSIEAAAVSKSEHRWSVFITDRGKPAHVLMTVEVYERLKAGRHKLPLVDFLRKP